MYIVHVSSESAPLAKVGGLGDMVAGLCRALAEKGEEVRVFLPLYDIVSLDRFTDVTEERGAFGTARTLSRDRLHRTLLDPEDARHSFKRGTIYGEEDDRERFITFCRAVALYLQVKKRVVDILHIHDWMTVATVMFCKNVRKTVLTIHNMQHQGVCRADLLCEPVTGSEEKINLLKEGIVRADRITTVSPSYAEEIVRNQGFGLEPVLRTYRSKLTGILNGIDTQRWNPLSECGVDFARTDSMHKITEVKAGERRRIAEALDMAEDRSPLFIAVTRLTQQKGAELLVAGARYIVERGGRYVLLGTFCDEKTEKTFCALREEYRNSRKIRFLFRFDEALSRKLYLAADFILIPSLFEPCGLTQMIALRYGTIPIVHAVGGLKDSIIDIDEESTPLNRRNGYTFSTPSEEALTSCIDRALRDYAGTGEKRRTIMRNGTKHDRSWDEPAKAYLAVYGSLLS
ncbi:MAG: glycogen/starch synthase [Simkaniaceae bacterium]|nr:glycogen/starch synthase [Simkaniaceae bacterium]